MRTVNFNDNYSDGAERSVGVAQTVTGTTVSVVPRRVNTQQTVQLTLTGMDTGATRNVNIVIDPPSGTGTVNFAKISPQTNNTNLNELYVFTLADDSFAFLHLGDYQDFLDSSMPITVPVTFNSEFEILNGTIGSLPDPYSGYDWGHMFMLVPRNSSSAIHPFERTRGSSQRTLAAVPAPFEYHIRIRDEFLQQPGGSRPFLRLKEIRTAGPIKIVTPTLRTQRIQEINPRVPLNLEVSGPGMIYILVEIAPRDDSDPVEIVLEELGLSDRVRDQVALSLRDREQSGREQSGMQDATFDSPSLDSRQGGERESDSLLR
jgi:hypothetical protein